MKKLLYLFLTLLIVGCSSEDGANNQDNNDGDNNGDNNDTTCEYVLNTLPVTNTTANSATFNGIISIDSNCEFPITEQGFVFSTEVQPTIADTQVNVNGTDVTTTIENLEPNTTYYARTFLTNALGEFYGNEVSFMTTEEPVNCDVVYLADNGVTIKAYECAEVGDTGVIDGVTYTVVDETMLREMVDNEEDVTKVVTTKVTDMSYMFYIKAGTFSNFNQDIGSWDVSNVTDMGVMFTQASAFNQPIGDWNVSNVTNMRDMFSAAEAFNQDIGDWNVSNVTNMRDMFIQAYAFNQPIGNWDVSSVTDMRLMFYLATAFNQPIGDWDVSNVTNMRNMFLQAEAFNQPIGNWDVSNVTYMNSMFTDAEAFNQDIGDWNVSSVTDMRGMFTQAYAFNQPIGNWDVSSVTDMRLMFYLATAFNQNLSSWSVDGVFDCEAFSNGATSWTLPQPNFTNCTP